MKIYLDDIRNPPDETWILARSYEDFMELVLSGDSITHISFDHDLGMIDNVEAASGMDAAKFFIDACLDSSLSSQLVQITIHSYNPVGAENIRSLFKSAKKHGVISDEVIVDRIL